MTSGEQLRPQMGTQEMGCDQGDEYREQLLALPLELDMSHTEEAFALLGGLGAGTYSYDRVNEYFKLNVPGVSPRRLHNAIRSSENIIPLEDSFYVNKPSANPDVERTAPTPDQASLVPVTVGEAIERLANIVQPGKAYTDRVLCRKTRGRLEYTEATMEAIYEALRLDPRFVIARQAEGESRTTYMLMTDEVKWQPLVTADEFLGTSLQELARRILDSYQTYDIRSKRELRECIVKGLSVPKSKEAEVKVKRDEAIETLLYDPRVFSVGRSRYIQILHGPEDHLKYDRLVRVERMAVGLLIEAGTEFISARTLTNHMQYIAKQRGIEVTEHAMRLLKMLPVIDPYLLYSSVMKKYKIAPTPRKPTDTTH